MNETVCQPSKPLSRHEYRRRAPMILLNGMAEQTETWYANLNSWSRYFDVKVPEFLVFDGESLHRHINSGGEITIDYLTERLAVYLDEFVQRPPYFLVGSSMGGQVVLTYATRYPEKVARLAVICAPGFHGKENLPVIEGVRRSKFHTLVESVFHQNHFASEELVATFQRKAEVRKWKKGILRTLQGTVGHSVAYLLEDISQPCLLIWGAEDQVIEDVAGAVRAATRIPCGRQIVIPHCGHAPQVEKARLVNKLIHEFLEDKLETIPPSLDANRFLSRAGQKRS